jgi:carbonic anhydrase
LAGQSDVEPGDYEHLASITDPISEAARAETETTLDRTRQNEAFVDRVTELNVRRTLREIREKSRTLREFADSGRIALVGAIYDIDTGRVNFLDSE